MVVERCRFIIMLMVRYVITMVIGDVTKEFARMRYGLVDCRQIQTLSEHLSAGAFQSSPKPHKLTPPPQESQQAVSQPTSGVRYTDRPLYMLDR